MYAFNENSWLQNGVNKKWYLTYFKKGDIWPDSITKKVGAAGVWACNAKYSWKFSIYMGQNLQAVIKKFKAIKIGD